MKPPVFLDRDGVINENRSAYVRKPSQWVPIPGAVESVARLYRAGYPVVVVTNQSGIARGYYTENDVKEIHSVMSAAFQAAGARVGAVYYCPHHPSEGCTCRKPETGMIEMARSELSLPRGGWMVGDAHTDMELGRRTGLSTVLVLTGRGVSQLEKIRSDKQQEPDHITASLVSAVDMILSTPLQKALPGP